MIKNYVISLVVLVVMDLSWVGLIAKDFYLSRLGEMILPFPKILPLLFFYALAVFAINYFVVSRFDNLSDVFFSGFLLGLLAYGTYDLTNLATLKNFPTDLAVIDALWGGLLFGVNALAVKYFV
jgi:uncharacterized membrane protein